MLKPPHSSTRQSAQFAAVASWLLIPFSFAVATSAMRVFGSDENMFMSNVFAVAFSATTVVAMAMGIRAYRLGRASVPPSGARFVGVLGALAAAGTWAFTALFAALLWASGGAWSGGAWG